MNFLSFSAVCVFLELCRRLSKIGAQIRRIVEITFMSCIGIDSGLHIAEGHNKEF